MAAEKLKSETDVPEFSAFDGSDRVGQVAPNGPTDPLGIWMAVYNRQPHDTRNPALARQLFATELKLTQAGQGEVAFEAVMAHLLSEAQVEEPNEKYL